MSGKSSGITQENPYLEKLVSKMFEINQWPRPDTDNEIKELEQNIETELKTIYPKDPSRPSLKLKTLRRLLNKENYDKGFGISSTLTPLAKLCQYRSWADFLAKNAEVIQGEETLTNPVDLFEDAETLTPGVTFKMGYSLARYIEVKYCGDCEFEILKYEGHGEDRTGDRVTGRWFKLEYKEKKFKGGKTENIPVIVGVLGNEIFDPVEL